MDNLPSIAGVVLAGGRSSRMGQDKAHLKFQGRKLADHMTELLYQTGLKEVFVSGRIGETCTSFECRCLQDKYPFAGPAAAIRGVVSILQNFDGVLFVPVDMPFLTPEILQKLLQQERCVHYESGPLPLYLVTKEKPGMGKSIKNMLLDMDVSILPIHEDEQDCFRNLNTPEDWKKVVNP
jgi:molybdopterin-guanine dinucleotide biosynthesis protein A